MYHVVMLFSINEFYKTPLMDILTMTQYYSINIINNIFSFWPYMTRTLGWYI